VTAGLEGSSKASSWLPKLGVKKGNAVRVPPENSPAEKGQAFDLNVGKPASSSNTPCVGKGGHIFTEGGKEKHFGDEIDVQEGREKGVVHSCGRCSR